MVRATLVAGSEEGFHLVHVVGDALFAEESAAVLRDEHVVFDADATEILVFLNFVEAEELCVRAFLAPEVNEGGDEIDARLVGDHVVKNIEDAYSDLRPVSLEHLPARILVDGMPFRSGTLVMQDDEEVDDKLSMNIDANEHSFSDLIGQLKCRDVPMGDDILIVQIGAGSTQPVVMKAQVDQKGEITLPYLLKEPVLCEGLTLDALKQKLIKCYQVYIRDPQVTVNFGEFDVKTGVSPWGTVTVLGEVVMPRATSDREWQPG